MMTEIFEKLKSLQDVLSNKFEIEKEIDEIPKILATKTELLNRLKRIYLQKNDELQKTKDRIKELRQKMIDAESEREKFEKQMDIIKTQREYEALDKEIKDATEKEHGLRRELMNQEKRLDEMKVSLEKEESLIKKQEEEVRIEQSKIKQEKKDKTKVLQKLEKEETKIVPGLDEDILFKFKRIIRSKSGLGIVPVQKGVCTGCHIILPPQFVNDVRVGKDIKFCPECSRILYFKEDEKMEEDISSLQFALDEEYYEEDFEEEEEEDEGFGSEADDD